MADSQFIRAKILIVDDQEPNRTLLEGLLKKQGYSSYMSLSDPRQVVSTVQEWEPDIILLDLMMPHMDGFAVMHALKPLIAQDDYLPILVLTADITSEAKRRALSEGAMDFLTKPFDASEVILRVNNLLQTRFLHLQLQNQNAILEDKVRERTAELERTHHKLESILTSAGEGIYGVDLEGRTTFINPAALQMLGYKLEEVLGQLQHALIHHTRSDGSPYPLEECPIYAAFMDAKVHYLDNEVFWRKDGSSFFVEYTSTPLWEGNEIVGAVVTFNDITERKQAEEALRQRELEFRSLAENIPDIVARFDPQLRHVYINEVIEKITGIPAESFIGKTNQDLSMPESNVELWDNKLRQVFDSGQAMTLEFDFSSPTGLRYFESRLIPELGPTGKVEKVLSIVRDITERKQAEKEIRYHARLLRHINDAVIATDDQFRITAWNRAAEKMYGWSSEEVWGRNLSEILSFGLTDEQRAENRELLEQSSISRSEGIHQRKDGKTIYVEANTIALIDERGKMTGYVTVNRDITDRKKAEEQTQLQLQRLKALRAIDIAISSSFNLSLTLDILLEQVIVQLHVDAAAILLFDAAARSLEYGAGRGFRTPDIRTARVRLGEGYAGKAVMERRTIHVPNLMENADELPANFMLMLKEEGFLDYYCVPLIVKGEVKGALEIFHRSSLESNPEWLDFLETLAGQAAIAIEDSTLFEHLQRSNQELFQAYDATIEGWSHALDLRDKETEGHTQRVTKMTLDLAQRFGFTEEQLRYIRWGALLHDIGKMGVPDNILLKPDKLTEDEWEIMRQHPTFAFEMLSPITYLKSSIDIPYCHHEKWDGTGYPRGLKGEVIPLAARLFAVVDVWDALRSDRPYRQGWSAEKTIEYIRSQSGTHFDPKVVEVFLYLIK